MENAGKVRELAGEAMETPGMNFWSVYTNSRDRRLVAVAVGVGHVPRPSAGDDLFDLLKLGLPAKFGAHFVGAGDQAWRVAGASGLLLNGDRLAAHAFAGCDDFADAGSTAGAQVIT